MSRPPLPAVGDADAPAPRSLAAGTAGRAAALGHLAWGLLGRSRTALALMGLTMALAALLISAGVHIWQGAPGAYEGLHALTGAPHAWFAVPDHPRREQAAAAITRHPAVAAETGRLPAAALALQAAGTGGTRRLEVRAYGIDAADLLRAASGAAPPGSGPEGLAAGGPGPGLPGFALVAGRWPQPGKAEMAVDAAMARALDLAVGQRVQLLGDAGAVEARIVGWVVSALHCPYPDCRPSPAVIPGRLLDQLARRPETVLGVRLHDPDAAPAVAFAARRAAAEWGVLVEAGNWRDLVAHQRMSHSLTAGFLLMAGALALAAGAAVTGHAVAAAAIAGRRVMGLARAVGCTPRQVMAAFGLGCGGVGLAAAGMGAPAGWLAAGRWLGGGLPGVPAGAPGAGWVPVALAVAGGAAAWAAWSARRPVRASVAAALGEGDGAVPVGLRVGLPGLPQLMVIRPVRPLVPAAAVAIGLAVAVGAATLASTLAAFEREPGRVGVFHQLAILGGALPAADVERLVRSEPAVAGFHREAWARVDVPAAASIMVRALAGDWTSAPWRVLAGGFVAGPGEIALGAGAMERLGVAPGDVIEVALGPRRARWRVAGAYLDLTNSGLVGAVAWETLAALYPGMEPGAWLLRLAPGADEERVRQRLLAAGGPGLAVIRVGFEPPAAVRTAGRLVKGLAVLLGGLAVVAVVQAATAAVREQRRDIGIMKAVGVTPAQLVAAMLAGMGGAAAGGAAAGAALGLVLSWAGFRAASAVSGVGELVPVFPWGQLVALAAAAPLVASLAALPGAFAAARAPAVTWGGETN